MIRSLERVSKRELDLKTLPASSGKDVVRPRENNECSLNIIFYDVVC